MHKRSDGIETNRKYDEYFDIRLARQSDIPRIMDFIREYWKKDHILATNRSFFEYEFLKGDQVSFVLALDKQSRELVGMVGYLIYSDEDVSGAMIKVKNDLPIPMLGLELMRRRELLTGYQRLVAVGVNPNTVVPALRKLFKRKVGIMEHGYMLSERNSYHIASIQERQESNRDIPSVKYREIKEIKDFNDTMNPQIKWNKLPYKSPEYIEKRYFKHPIYHYRKFLLEAEIEHIFVVAREVCHDSSTILRIVDFIGDINKIYLVASLAKQLLQGYDYEYIDFMVGGLEEGVLSSAGFAVLRREDVNIIPNYFEPFMQKNIEVWYEATEDLVVFRADGDGDRPSI